MAASRAFNGCFLQSGPVQSGPVQSGSVQCGRGYFTGACRSSYWRWAAEDGPGPL